MPRRNADRPVTSVARRVAQEVIVVGRADEDALPLIDDVVAVAEFSIVVDAFGKKRLDGGVGILQLVSELAELDGPKALKGVCSIAVPEIGGQTTARPLVTEHRGDEGRFAFTLHRSVQHEHRVDLTARREDASNRTHERLLKEGVGHSVRGAEKLRGQVFEDLGITP